MFDRSLLLCLGLVACASASTSTSTSTPTPTPTPDATAAPEPPVAEEAPVPIATPEQEPVPASEPAAAGGPPPPPPPRPLAPTDAFHVLDLPGTAKPPGAEICGSNEACEPLTPGENFQVVRDFGGENWVVVTAPGAHDVAVVSDGKTATATLTPRCPGSEGALGKAPRIVLWRVAKAVTAAKVRTAAKCSKDT